MIQAPARVALGNSKTNNFTSQLRVQSDKLNKLVSAREEVIDFLKSINEKRSNTVYYEGASLSNNAYASYNDRLKNTNFVGIIKGDARINSENPQETIDIVLRNIEAGMKIAERSDTVFFIQPVNFIESFAKDPCLKPLYEKLKTVNSINTSKVYYEDAVIIGEYAFSEYSRPQKMENLLGKVVRIFDINPKNIEKTIGSIAIFIQFGSNNITIYDGKIYCFSDGIDQSEKSSIIYQVNKLENMH